MLSYQFNIVKLIHFLCVCVQTYRARHETIGEKKKMFINNKFIALLHHENNYLKIAIILIFSPSNFQHSTAIIVMS